MPRDCHPTNTPILSLLSMHPSQFLVKACHATCLFMLHSHCGNIGISVLFITIYFLEIAQLQWKESVYIHKIALYELHFLLL